MNKPVMEFRESPVRAAIWENTAENGGTYMTVLLSRSYKDREGAFKDAHSLRKDDLPKALVVLQQALNYLSSSEAGEA